MIACSHLRGSTKGTSHGWRPLDTYGTKHGHNDGLYVAALPLAESAGVVVLCLCRLVGLSQSTVLRNGPTQSISTAAYRVSLVVPVPQSSWRSAVFLAAL